MKDYIINVRMYEHPDGDHDTSIGETLVNVCHYNIILLQQM